MTPVKTERVHIWVELVQSRREFLETQPYRHLGKIPSIFQKMEAGPSKAERDGRGRPSQHDFAKVDNLQPPGRTCAVGEKSRR